jgi:hypothetical protein
METTLVIIPNEVQQLAEKVTAEKQQEVSNVLNQIFTGTSDWENQVDAIEVKGIDDRMSINLADAARLNVKKARISAEKIFDAKREEVQQRMSDFKTEDALWLKAKQIMQIKFKAIEDKAEWKAKYVERYEKEQRELRTENRRLQVQKFSPDVALIEFENMSDETFSVFISGIEKAYNDKIEAARKAEEERIAKEKAEAEERERIRLENERLKLEAIEKEKQMVAERAKAEAERKAVELKAKKEKELADAKLKAEKEANEKLQAEIRAKAEAEQKAKREAAAKVEAEKKAKELAEKKAKAAPDKQKLVEFAQLIDSINLPDLRSEEGLKILSDAKTLLSKVSHFVREKSSSM